MKVISGSPGYSAAKAMEKAIQGQDYDDAEAKIIVRFEEGVDFDTFDEFRNLFIRTLNAESQAWGERQMQRFEQMYRNSFGSEGGFNGGGIEVGIPTATLNKSVLEELLTESS